MTAALRFGDGSGGSGRLAAADDDDEDNDNDVSNSAARPGEKKVNSRIDWLQGWAWSRSSDWINLLAKVDQPLGLTYLCAYKMQPILYICMEILFRASAIQRWMTSFCYFLSCTCSNGLMHKSKIKCFKKKGVANNNGYPYCFCTELNCYIEKGLHNVDQNLLVQAPGKLVLQKVINGRKISQWQSGKLYFTLSVKTTQKAVASFTCVKQLGFNLNPHNTPEI